MCTDMLRWATAEVKEGQSLNKNEGGIEFSTNGTNYSDVNSPQLTYPPKGGDIVLFSASLNHRTRTFSTDANRIVIAFDLLQTDY